MNHETIENKLIERYGENNWWYQNKMNLTLSRIDAPNAHVLDVGCGCGLVGRKLAEKGSIVTFVEPDYNSVSNLMKKLPKYHRIIKQTAENINFDKKFTHCIMLDVLEHIEDDVSVLHKIYKALKPGGSLILNIPALQFLVTNHDMILSHYRRYTKKEICSKLKRVGFEIKEVKSWNFLTVFVKLASKYFFHKMNISEAHWTITNTKLNSLLKYYLKIENLINPPIGCSLFVVAIKPIK